MPAELTRAAIERLAGDLTADTAALDHLVADCATQSDVLRQDPSNRGAAALLAIGMHGYYTAIESALERIERHLAAPPQPGPAWHHELLTGATRAIGEARPAVLSSETARGLDKLRAFRHFLRHAYAVELDPRELLQTATHLDRVHPGVQRELASFIDFVRRLAPPLA